MDLIAHFHLELHHMDVKTTFVNGDLNEDVFMIHLEGFKPKGKQHLVYILKKFV